MDIYQDYTTRLAQILKTYDWSKVDALVEKFEQIRATGKRAFICGNGGSGANAMHWANDLTYGAAQGGRGISCQALSANAAVITCLGNDIGYENIFSYQLNSYAQKGDLLLVFSGSGNSPNIVNVLDKARELGVFSAAILGYDGGKCLGKVDLPIHFQLNDMGMSEDLQMIVCHMLTRKLSKKISC